MWETRKKEDEYNMYSYSRNKADIHISGQTTVMECLLCVRHSLSIGGKKIRTGHYLQGNQSLMRKKDKYNYSEKGECCETW